MEEKREDCLVTYLLQRNPWLSFPKRKRRTPFKTMEELREIKETNGPKRNVRRKHKETRSHLGKRAMMNNLQSEVEIISSVMERAQEVQANLNTKFPSFVKPMSPSNVGGGFWLSLPRLFCQLHLPSSDKKITLVDESRNEYFTRYLSDRRGLSAGWRRFSIAHHLGEEDVLVFHLIGACKMKVYIVRANDFGAVEAALSLLHLQTQSKRAKYEHIRTERGNLPPVREKLLGPLSLEPLWSNVKKDRQSSKIPLVNHIQNIPQAVTLALEGLILETSIVAKAIKVCKLTSSPQNLTFWKQRSTSFEYFQIVISQIRPRLDQLVCLALDPQSTSVRNRQDVLDQDSGVKLSVFEEKVEELKEATQRLYAEAEVLKINADMHKIKF